MKKLIFVFSFLFFIFSCVKDGTVVVNEYTENRNLIIPLYKEDSNLWDKVISLDIDNLIAVVNPDNGVGTAKSSFYEDVINRLILANKKPIGYIYTDYGTRDINEVKDEIDRWISFYPNIEGFFIDEVSGTPDKYDYYEEIYLYIQSKGNYFTVFNVGAYPDESYFYIADNIVVYEGDKTGLDYTICNFHPSQSSIIVYNASQTDMEDIIKNTSCKYVYITDDTLPTPYDNLPSYIDLEVEYILNY